MSGCLAFGSDRFLCSLDRAAALMSEHHDQAHGQMIDRVLDAAQAMIADHVAGHAQDKQIAESLIEYDLGRNTRVGAAKNDSKRMLTFRQLLAPLCHVRKDQARVFIAVGCQPCSFVDRLMWMLRIASGVALIALFEPGDRFSGRNDWLVGVIRIGGADKLVATN